MSAVNRIEYRSIDSVLMKRMVSGKTRYYSASALILLIVALVCVMLAGCGTGSASGGAGQSQASEPVTGENYFLDTVCTLSIYEMKDQDGNIRPAADMEEDANAAIKEAFDECAELDKKLSRTNDASEISRINNAGGEWTEVSDITADLVRMGLKYSELSEGDFDITIGGVTDLWDFHADPEDARVPDEDEMAKAVSHVDYMKVETDGSRIRITDPDARIDLGGIAKGYIGDRMTELLEGKGVTSGIINLGGNVICIGGKNADTDFVVGVETPYSDRTEVSGKISARDMTLVTSGVYERQIEVDGVRYHHILSTETGYSVKTDLDAVTLTAAKGMSADIDALSTICLIKGADAAQKLIESMDGIEAVLILSDGTIRTTDGMEFEPI